MANTRTLLSDVVAKQLPEHIRESYPTFVAFVEAYYEYLQQQSVDISSARDIDTTLEEFIVYFKKELAHNYPIAATIVSDERFLLTHIRDQYLAKGSEASYKLLFRLLFGKNVSLEYPGRSMLRASDGRWRQDYSIFVNVEFGSPEDIVGKVVDIATSNRVVRVMVDKNQSFNEVYGSVERYVQLTDTIYELFIDRRFYGTIQPGDVVKYKSKFQGRVVSTTSELSVTSEGEDFRVGQVFQVQSGEGTPAWMKVLSVTATGGLRSVEFIKFGIGYTTDFAVTLLPSSEIQAATKIKTTPATLSYTFKYGVVKYITLTSGGSGYTQPPQVAVSGNGRGCVAYCTIDVNGSVDAIYVTDGGQNYNTAVVTFIPAAGDESATPAEAIAEFGNYASYNVLDKVVGFNESGVLNYGAYWDGGKTLTTGAITLVHAWDRGRGYTTSPSVNIYDPLGVNYSADTNLLSTEHALTFSVSDQGLNYIKPVITVSGGGGSGAKLEPVLNESGSITDIVVVSQGEGYTSLPTVTVEETIINNGSGAVFTVNTNGFGSYELDITSPGLGYGRYFKLKITGDKVGGTSPANDIELIVLSIDAYGGIKSIGASWNTSVGTDTFLNVTADNINDAYGAVIDVAYDGYKLKEVLPILSGGTNYINPIVYIGSEGSKLWESETTYVAGDMLYAQSSNKYYLVMKGGATSTTAPSHTVDEYDANQIVSGREYTISSLGTTNWNVVFGTVSKTYVVGETAIAMNTGTGTGKVTSKIKANGDTLLKYVTVSDGSGTGAKAHATQNIVHGYSDAAYVGEAAREFFIDYKNTTTGNPAVVTVKLGALAKYPGYFETNDGFLSDAIFVQDSKYYQSFSYVIKIDEQLNSYSAAVRSMLHPTGMALFGEYNVTNNFDIGLALESLVKSLGITLRDAFSVSVDAFKNPETTYERTLAQIAPDLLRISPAMAITKDITSYSPNYVTMSQPYESMTINGVAHGLAVVMTLSKQVDEDFINTHYPTTAAGSFSIGTPYEIVSLGTTDWNDVAGTTGLTYSVGDTFIAAKGGAGTGVARYSYVRRVFGKSVTDTAYATEDGSVKEFTKDVQDPYGPIQTYGYGMTDFIVSRFFEKSASDEIVILEVPSNEINKYIDEPSTGTYIENGYSTYNPFEQGGYFQDVYANSRAGEFSN